MKIAFNRPSLRAVTASRVAKAVAVFTLAASLAACGGGGSEFGTFDVTVAVEGRPTGAIYGPGSSPAVSVRAGQSIELDASEPVIWTLYVGGTAVDGSTGTVVSYAGADVVLTNRSSSRIALDTYAAFPLSRSIPVTLVATSTYDSAIVATINVLITN